MAQARVQVAVALLTTASSLFGFATLHEFLSEYFMSGGLLASYFLKSRTFQRPLELNYEGFPETIQAYRALLAGSAVVLLSLSLNEIYLRLRDRRFAHAGQIPWDRLRRHARNRNE